MNQLNQLGETAEQFYSEGSLGHMFRACQAGDWKTASQLLMNENLKTNAKDFCAVQAVAKQNAGRGARVECKGGGDVGTMRADTFTLDGGHLVRIDMGAGQGVFRNQLPGSLVVKLLGATLLQFGFYQKRHDPSDPSAAGLGAPITAIPVEPFPLRPLHCGMCFDVSSANGGNGTIATTWKRNSDANSASGKHAQNGTDGTRRVQKARRMPQFSSDEVVPL